MQSDTEKLIRKAGRAEGRVQGVGFRYFVRNMAKSLGATGWVRNMSDGSVVMELQGTPPAIEELTEKIKAGRGRIRVTNFEVINMSVVEGENKFAIRH